MVKTSKKIEIEGNFLNWMKGMTANIAHDGKILKIGNKARCSLSSVLFNIVSEVLSIQPITCIPVHLSLRMFIAALFLITKTWYLSISEWLNKPWYSLTKRN